MNVGLSADYDKRVSGKVLKWIATVNAAAKAGATDQEIKAMDEYASILAMVRGEHGLAADGGIGGRTKRGIFPILLHAR